MNALLVPTDFSANAANAIAYAAEYAAATSGKLCLVHVYTPTVSTYNVMSALISEEVALATKDARERLQLVCETIQHEYPDIECFPMVRVGEVVKEIIDGAEEIKADIIVMGTRGASDLGKLIFGSNTQAIIEKATCAVLSVPDKAPFAIPQKILFATNFTYSDVKNALQIAQIAKAFNSTIIIGHVQLPNDKVSPKQSIEKFTKEVRWLTDYPHISYKIFSDNSVNMGLDNMIDETGADLLALSTRRRTLFEKFYNPSITKKFSSYSTIPLLAFHTPVDELQDITRDF